MKPRQAERFQVASGSRAGAPAPHGHGHGGIHESPKVMLIPLVILAVLSICGGWVRKLGASTNSFRRRFTAGVTA